MIIRHGPCVQCRKTSTFHGLAQVCDVCLAHDTREELVASIKKLRAMCESEIRRQFDLYCTKHGITDNDKKHTEWCCVEVGTWPDWKQNYCRRVRGGQ